MVNRTINNNVQTCQAKTTNVLKKDLYNSNSNHSVKQQILNTESVGDKLKNSICLSTGNETFRQNKLNIKQKDFCIDKQYDKKKLIIFHQNIRGLRDKANKILRHFSAETPHCLFFTEHNLSESEIQTIYIDNYTLGACYCRNQVRMGGVCIFVKNVINYSSLSLETFCVNKDIEVCAVKLNILSRKVCMIAIYRSPSGNFLKFMDHLELILQSLYNPKTGIVICGDINLNYLEETKRVKQLNDLFKTFNLTSIANFPTRICASTSTAINNIFIDIFKYDCYSVSSLHNGLSDYEAQLPTIVLPQMEKSSPNLFL
jgi:exonuclease III